MKIEEIKYENFKCLADEKIKLGNLTLLSGINSSGKSTTIQGLLLLKQNIKELPNNLIDALDISYKDIFELINRLRLNGFYTNLGTINKILYRDAHKDEINISLKTNKGRMSIKSNLEKVLDRTVEDNYPCTVEVEGNAEIDFLREDVFQYLSANRISPLSHYPYSNEKIELNNIGIEGEFSAHFLSKNSGKPLNIPSLQHENSLEDTLGENVSRWLSTISEGIKIEASINPSIMQAYLNYSYEGINYSPQEIGFGLTYSLPIILGILKSKPGDVLIIENPESHLHPSGQVQVALLCAKAAKAGVQIIIESHSDHFLNGIRVAIKEEYLNPEEVKVHYFKKENGRSNIEEIPILKNGDIGRWPKGFFDEFENQLVKLI